MNFTRTTKTVTPDADHLVMEDVTNYTWGEWTISKITGGWLIEKHAKDMGETDTLKEAKAYVQMYINY